MYHRFTQRVQPAFLVYIQLWLSHLDNPFLNEDLDALKSIHRSHSSPCSSVEKEGLSLTAVLKTFSYEDSPYRGHSCSEPLCELLLMSNSLSGRNQAILILQGQPFF